jgi:Acetyltransferase (GNAT) domain
LDCACPGGTPEEHRFNEGATRNKTIPRVHSGSSQRFLVQRVEDPQALRDLVPSLRTAGLWPPPIVQMDPEYLAEACEGSPGVLIALVHEWPVAYLAYIARRATFPLPFGPVVLARLPSLALQVTGYQSLSPDDDAILPAFFEALLRAPSWQILRVSGIPVEHPLARYLAALADDAAQPFRITCEVLETWHVQVEGTFEEYLLRRFSAKTRYNLRREVRLLETHAARPVSVKVYSREDQVEEFLERAESVARKTYQWRLGFPTVRVATELRRMLALARKGQWRSYILFLGSDPAAYCYATIRYGALDYYLIGYDPRFADVHPGKVLLFRMIEDLFAARVADRLDFGTGPAEYKRLFATTQQFVLSASLYREATYPRLIRASTAALRRAWSWVDPRIPCLKQRVKRYVRDRGRLTRGSRAK